MDVIDVNDEKIGSVEEIYDAATPESRTGGYFRVPTGFLGLGETRHIPFTAIRDIRGDRIYLNVAKDRLDEHGYNEAPIELDEPVERTTTSRGGETTQRLQLREEVLVPRTRSVQTGEVEVGTRIVTEKQTVEVPVSHEEVTVERRAVDRRPSDQPISEQRDTITVPVHGEEVTIDKQTVVYEEVDVTKRDVRGTERVSETVRREEAEIDKDDDVEVRDKPR
jgi:uncharacterized protein (TIGR02271 family)